MTRNEMTSSRFRRVLWALATSALLSGCAQGYLNRPLSHWEGGGDSGTLSGSSRGHRSEQSDELLLMLSFSGGGTRAAAFSYGVLETLARTKVRIDGRDRRLLDEVDAISATSGGSFTAAYYALFGDRIFEDFESRFLDRNFQRAVVSRFFLPHNWIRMLSPRFGRSDLAAEYFDRHLFDGRTFGDLSRQGRTSILINASDMPVGARFGFAQSQFDAICSDLAPFPIARAVAASAAVPIALSPIVLRNHAGRCDYQPPSWMAEALEERDTTSRRFQSARVHMTYLDAEARPYIHLVDGGLADNLGLRGFLDPVLTGESLWQTLRDGGFGNARHVVIIAVDSESIVPDRSGFWRLTPGVGKILAAVLDTPIRLYGYETIDLLRTSFERFERVETQRAGGDPQEPRAFTFHTIHVAFDALEDPEERAYLSSLSSLLHIGKDAVERLRRGATTLLEGSDEFERLLEVIAAEAAAADSIADSASEAAP